MTFATYAEARDHAIVEVRRMGRPHGIERMHGTYSRGYRVFMLPAWQYRAGYELQCEAFEPSDYRPLPQVKP